MYPVSPFTTTTTTTFHFPDQFDWIRTTTMKIEDFYEDETTTPMDFVSTLTNEYLSEDANDHQRTTTITPSLIIDI